MIKRAREEHVLKTYMDDSIEIEKLMEDCRFALKNKILNFKTR